MRPGTSAGSATPLRELGTRTDEGWISLRDTGSTYLDGAEAWLYDTVLATADVSSSSTDLVLQARDWAERYHTDPARSNVMRPFAISPDARVLEIGAGCGAVTRYLGEVAGLVDAVEPVAARARVARARTRDLPNVEVFVGMTDDVPADPVYDLVVVVGVLEYVGGGSESREPYLRFLADAAGRLADGGSLILAIENKIGVKYFAGAPEDHTGRYFDSLESYPHGTIARTFSRSELEAMIRAVGLEPSTKVAFPDYKLVRTVLDAARTTQHSPLLAKTVPHLPTFDWYKQRPHGVDERLLWSTMVDADLGHETGNSFVVVATKPGATSPWREELVGAYYSVGRLQEHLTATEIREVGSGLVTERRLIRGGAADGRLTFVGGRDDVHALPGLVDEVVRADDDGVSRLLGSWLALIEERRAEPVLVDLIPQNVLVRDDGSLVVIDQEWTDAEADWDLVVRRGLLRLALGAVDVSPPARWPGATTVRDVATRLGALSGAALPADWLERALDDESQLQHLTACPPYAGGRHRAPEWWRAQLAARLEGVLADLPSARTEADGPGVADAVRASFEHELVSCQAELASYQEQTRDLRARAAELDGWIAAAVLREEAAAADRATAWAEVSAQSARATQLGTELGDALARLEVAAEVISRTHTTAVRDQRGRRLAEARLADAEARLADAEAQLERIAASRSWQVAGWLRNSTAVVRRAVPRRSRATGDGR
jgi:2-polyprenyl-3-methyl-5-hydroxy-6-metoxy-1,4-benzoquinol methylase